MRTASVKGGYNVEAFSGWGYRTNKAGQRVGTFHDDGMALDMRLIGDNGKPIPNFQNARSFRAYEEFAQNARLVQMQKYPADPRLLLGGYFSKASRGGTGMDMMHFDLGAGGLAWLVAHGKEGSRRPCARPIPVPSQRG